MLPHITNSAAGVNKYDVVSSNLFECYFTIPEAIRAEFGKDEMLLTEHVLKVGGLDALDRAPSIVEQKFMGTTRSYIGSKLDSTAADITISLSLNLRNVTDNYIYKLIKAWAKLGYDISTGEKHLKKDYCADWLRIVQANRDGSIWREVIFKDVMMASNLSGLADLDYESADPQTLDFTLRSDWWTEQLA